MRWIVAALLAIVVLPVARVGAGPLGVQIPPHCSAQGALDDGVDLVDDYRCAGMAIEFHTAGVAYSPAPIWAGQWLFVDESGQFRAGSCVFNRGLHPNVDGPAVVVEQSFPNDPTGRKSAYLMWRYGETTDDLTAAGLWAVMHYYAQDAAGSRRAADPTAPLVASLEVVAPASGRDDIQAMALALDAEANRVSGDWTLTTEVAPSGRPEARLRAGDAVLAGFTVSFLVSGRDEPIVETTDAEGVARAAVDMTSAGGTVVASTAAPGPVLTYQGAPAGRHRQGGQRLVTGGAPTVLTATASVDVPATTIASTTTTAIVPTTTSTTTTTTVVPETSPSIPPDTIAVTVAATTPATVATEAVVPQPSSPLPTTGKGTQRVSYVATAVLVAGVGLRGVATRRSGKGPLHSSS